MIGPVALTSDGVSVSTASLSSSALSPTDKRNRSQAPKKSYTRSHWTLLHRAESAEHLQQLLDGLKTRDHLRKHRSYRTTSGTVRIFACMYSGCNFKVRAHQGSLTVETTGQHCHISGETIQRSQPAVPTMNRLGATDQLQSDHIDHLVRYCKETLKLVPLAELKQERPVKVEEVPPPVGAPPQRSAKAVKKLQSKESSKWEHFEEKLDLLLGMLAGKVSLCRGVEKRLFGEGPVDSNALEQHLLEIKHVCYLIKSAIRKVFAEAEGADDQSEVESSKCFSCQDAADKLPTVVCANDTCKRTYHLKCIHSSKSSVPRDWLCPRCLTASRCLPKVSAALETHCTSFADVIATIAEEDFVWEDWIPRTKFNPENAVESMIRGKTAKIFRRIGLPEDDRRAPRDLPEKIELKRANDRTIWEIFELRLWDSLQNLLREMYFYETYTHRRRDHEHELIDASELGKYRRRILNKQAEIKGIFDEILSVHAGDRKFPQLCIADEYGNVDLEGIYCSRCGGSDELENDILVCDKEDCCRAFHQNCLCPTIDPMTVESESYWFCWECDTVNECLAWINEACGTNVRKVDELFVEEDEMDKQLRLEGYREEDDEDYDPQTEEFQNLDNSGSDHDSDSDYASDDFLGGNESASRSSMETTGSRNDIDDEGRMLRKSTLLKHVGPIEEAESDSSLSDDDFCSDGSNSCEYTDYRSIVFNEGSNIRNNEEFDDDESGEASDECFDSGSEDSVTRSCSGDDIEDNVMLASRRTSRSRGGDLVEGMSFQDDYEESDSEMDEVTEDIIMNTDTASSTFVPHLNLQSTLSSSLKRKKAHIADSNSLTSSQASSGEVMNSNADSGSAPDRSCPVQSDISPVATGEQHGGPPSVNKRIKTTSVVDSVLAPYEAPAPPPMHRFNVLNDDDKSLSTSVAVTECEATPRSRLSDLKDATRSSPSADCVDNIDSRNHLPLTNRMDDWKGSAEVISSSVLSANTKRDAPQLVNRFDFHNNKKDIPSLIVDDSDIEAVHESRRNVETIDLTQDSDCEVEYVTNFKLQSKA